MVQRFEDCTGADTVAALKRSFPALARFPMAAIPDSFDTVLVKSPKTEDVVAALTWATAHAHSSGLGLRLEKHWDLLHRTIMEDHCPGTARVVEEASECW